MKRSDFITNKKRGGVHGDSPLSLNGLRQIIGDTMREMESQRIAPRIIYVSIEDRYIFESIGQLDQYDLDNMQGYRLYSVWGMGIIPTTALEQGHCFIVGNHPHLIRAIDFSKYNLSNEHLTRPEMPTTMYRR